MPEVVLTSCIDRKSIRKITVPSGSSVRGCACQLLPAGVREFQTATIAMLDGKPVVRKDGGWEATVLAESATLVFVTDLPRGGGGGGSGSVVTIVAMVAALAVATFMPAMLVSMAPAVFATEASLFGAIQGGALVANGLATFISGLVASGIMLAGSLLASSMAKAQGQTLASNAQEASPTYNINSQGNQARLYQCEPETFGRMRVCPDYVAQNYTDYQANDQYGYYWFGLGRGEYNVEKLYFGDTVFWKNGSPIFNSGYVDESGRAYKLNCKNKTLPPKSGNTLTTVGTYQPTSQFDMSRTFDITFTFPDGLYTWEYYSYEGYNADSDTYYTEYSWRKIDATVEIKCEARRLDVEGNVLSDWSEVGIKTITDTLAAGATVKWRIKRSPAGRWQFRFTNLSSALQPVEETGLNMYFQPVVVSTSPDPAYACQLSTIECRGLTVIVEIVSPNTTPKLFPTNVVNNSEVAGQELFADNDPDLDGTKIIGPFAACPPGTVANRISVDVCFNQGLVLINSKGNYCKTSVTYKAEYQYINDDGSIADQTWYELGTWTKKNATVTPQRYTHTVDLVRQGRVHVRMYRTSNTHDPNDHQSQCMDAVTWTGMKAFLPGGLKCPQTTIAVMIKATNTLTSSASRQFYAQICRKLPLYNRSTHAWSSPVATRSWGAAFCAIAKASYGGRLKDRQLDLDKIWAIDARLQAKHWCFDATIDGAYNVWTLIAEVCRCELCLPRMEGTILSVIEDTTGRPVQFALTPRNIVRGTFKPSWALWTSDSIANVTMNYLDENAGYAQRDVTAEIVESDSFEPTTLDWIGITNRDHAFKVALGYAARNRHRRETVELQVEGLGRLINIGDVCTVSHPRFTGTASGVVSAWNPSSRTLTLEQDHSRGDTGAYISLAKPDGMVWGPCLCTSVSESEVVLDAADYASCGSIDSFAEDAQYTLHSSSTFSRRMLVQSVNVDSLYRYTLTLCNDAEEIDDYDSWATPVWGGRNQS